MGIVKLSLEHLPSVARGALELARDVAPKSYNKYSGSQVGAVAVASSGAMFESAFVENASYGLTVCAEPGALMQANAKGASDISMFAVVGGDPTSIEGPPCTPCGQCRQVLWEYAQRGPRGDMELYCADLSLKNILLVTVRELLPYAWGDQSWWKAPTTWYAPN